MGVLEEDYLMRMIAKATQVISGINDKEGEYGHFDKATADELEPLISNIIGLDADILLSMSPGNMAEFLTYGNLSYEEATIVGNLLRLEASALIDEGNDFLGILRYDQSQAIQDAFGVTLSDTPEDLEWLKHYCNE